MVYFLYQLGDSLIWQVLLVLHWTTTNHDVTIIIHLRMVVLSEFIVKLSTTFHGGLPLVYTIAGLHVRHAAPPLSILLDVRCLHVDYLVDLHLFIFTSQLIWHTVDVELLIEEVHTLFDILLFHVVINGHEGCHWLIGNIGVVIIDIRDSIMHLISIKGCIKAYI